MSDDGPAPRPSTESGDHAGFVRPVVRRPRVRTTLRLPRVDFDLGALAFGTIGYLLLMLLWRGLAALIQPDLPNGGRTYLESAALQQHFLNDFIERVGNMPLLEPLLQAFGFATSVSPDGAAVAAVELRNWHYVVVAALLLVVWSLISGVLSRMYALRIARDETEELDDAVLFVGRNVRGFLLAPLFIVGAAALFAVLTMLGGAASAIPHVGGVLQIVLHPLTLLSSVAVLVITVGGVFGLPLLHAALSTERNGTLDAVSRTYSYAFTRPVAYGVGLVITAAVSTVIWQFGHWFVDWVWVQGFAQGAGLTEAAFGDGAGASAGAAEAIGRGFHAGRLLSWPDGAGLAGTGARINMWVTWLFTGLAIAVVRGTVVSYVVGAFTDIYFQLRGEVDGTDESQVYVAGTEAARFE